MVLGPGDFIGATIRNAIPMRVAGRCWCGVSVKRSPVDQCLTGVTIFRRPGLA